jgi:uncharacterized membrane protein YkvA (DUF1232 family)
MSNLRNILRDPGDGFISKAANHVRLVWRLIQDSRVSPLLKLLPLGSLVYFVIPFDVPGPFDDAAVIWFTTYMFIELCPPDVVAEHRAAIERITTARTKDSGPPIADEDILDANFEEN